MIVAIIGAVGLVAANLILGWFTFKAAGETRKQVTPSNGTRTAEMVEQLAANFDGLTTDFRDLKDDFRYHVTVQHGRGPIYDEEDFS